jgi:hypothetical protein
VLGWISRGRFQVFDRGVCGIWRSRFPHIRPVQSVSLNHHQRYASEALYLVDAMLYQEHALGLARVHLDR